MLPVDSNLLSSVLLTVLRQEDIDPSILDRASPKEQRQVLGDVLIASNIDWKQETLTMLDQVLQNEPREVVEVASLQPTSTYNGTQIVVWQGDISTLATDAIVNAANEQGLGCFQPSHRCVDNVIHRAAGPRLRQECRTAMKERGSRLMAGSLPLVTRAHHLPSRWVLHVTGPQVQRSVTTQVDRDHLAAAYRLSLEEAQRLGARSIAFPCISTGLFGFPAPEATEIALSTVQSYLNTHDNALDAVVFNTFTDTDTVLYHTRVGEYFPPDDRTMLLDTVKTWLDTADAVVICAGAGMSVKPGEMVYTNPHDFEKAYPWFTKWGYRTSYEAMALEADPSVPRTAKWALYAKHMDNMRWSFTPNEGYSYLLDLVKDKDHFVLTSNVDACFERAGFDPSRIYTPQGEWSYVQCTKPCASDSVFPSRPYIDAILPHISENGEIPSELLPKCPRCGSDMFGNVRGGSWFLHHMYDDQNAAFVSWMERLIQSNASVVFLEIGAGFNTPTVTRFPMESAAMELGDRARFVRINPSDPEIPSSIQGVALAEGWQVLKEISGAHGVPETRLAVNEELVVQHLGERGLVVPTKKSNAVHRYFGHFNWRKFLQQLK